MDHGAVSGTCPMSAGCVGRGGSDESGGQVQPRGPDPDMDFIPLVVGNPFNVYWV